ncbi:MAG: winged helix-turn-helix domain-containing protein [Candidatus Bathyarchaeota archaeon]|nr:winged helix-turn-helix domain-containing protein [Candidatus Bathyarchaeota archaeon]
MRHLDPEYAFSHAELQLLREIANRKQSLPQIRRSLSIKPSLLSHNLNKLKRKGLVQTTEQGNRKYACFNEAKHASLLRDLLVAYDYVDWENVLSGKAIEILFQALTDKESKLSGFSGATLWRYLKELKARGIITQTQKSYQINPQFPVLIEFLKEYQQYFANKISKTLSENAVILWQHGMDFLVRAPKTAKLPSDNFYKTVTSIFVQYGLPLFSDFDIYFYSTSKKAIKPEDAILHTLLVEPGNVRYITYALLLFKKTEKQIDKTYLLQEAERLGLKTQVMGMLQFLETHEPQEGQQLPMWGEFVEKASGYGVSVD